MFYAPVIPRQAGGGTPTACRTAFTIFLCQTSLVLTRPLLRGASYLYRERTKPFTVATGALHDVRPHLHPRHVRVLCADAGVRPGLHRPRQHRIGRDRGLRSERSMTIESWVAGLLAIAILVYLVYTLLRPEKF